MTFWQKLTIGAKFLFGGWESALEYLLDIVNELMATSAIKPHTQKILDTTAWALEWLNKISRFVPNCWRNEYFAICDIIADCHAVAKDHVITLDEAKGLAESFKEAKEKWDAE